MHDIPAAYTIVVLGVFCILIYVVLAMLENTIRQNTYKTVVRRIQIFIILWAFIAFIVSYSMFFVKTGVPAGPFGVVLGLFGLVLLFLNRGFKTIIMAIPLPSLILLQTARVIGGVFFVAYLNGLLPAYWAITTAAGDIITGVFAPLVAYVASQKIAHWKWYVTLWSMVGIADFVHGIIVALLSSPAPFQIYYPLPTLDAMNYLPFVFIPLFSMPLLLIVHIIILLRVRNQK